MKLAERIQLLRKSRGISQEELADYLGVSRQAVSKWESDQSTPDIERVILLSDFFETTTDYLLKGIEPTKETEKNISALVFSIVGTFLNAVGLVCSIIVWIEHQRSYAVALGVLSMLLGTSIFLIGQAVCSKDSERAKRFFLLPNIWILLLIPLSCSFNIVDGILGGFSAQLAPIPLLGNSMVTFAFCWVLYCAVCIAVDIAVAKRYSWVKKQQPAE